MYFCLIIPRKQNLKSGNNPNYDKTAVSAFTRGCEWNGQCGSDYKRDWALDQIFFNLVNCDGSRKQLYIDTFGVVIKMANFFLNILDPFEA